MTKKDIKKQLRGLVFVQQPWGEPAVADAQDVHDRLARAKELLEIARDMDRGAPPPGYEDVFVEDVMERAADEIEKINEVDLRFIELPGRTDEGVPQDHIPLVRATMTAVKKKMR